MAKPSLNLSNKIAIVTGAANGIGRATAKLFCAHGAKVIGVDRDLKGLKSLQHELDNKIDIYEVEITNKDAVKSYIKQVYNKYNKINILANIAGITGGGEGTPFHESDLSLFENTMNVNLYGSIYHCYYVIPYMLKTIKSERKRLGSDSFTCSIINTSSEASVRAYPGLCGYTVSKFGINGLTLSLCSEYSASGIRCNAIKPGNTKTTLARNYTKEAIMKLMKVISVNDIPMERRAQPEEIAGLFLYLASDQSSFCTGSLMSADGGRSNSYTHFPSML